MMTMYLLCVLFAYYILKPVSRAMFLDKFDIDKLPYLYILIAAVGGVMAYVYTRIAINASLKTAVNAATFFIIGCLLAIWYLLSLHLNWMLYVFNIFVSLFSITLVSQGWLVASNVFTTREAKRVYGVLGLGAVIGAAFGGSFTAIVVQYTGSRNLVLASAGMVLLSWFAFLGILRQKGVSLERAKGAEAEESFSLGEVGGNIARHRHLQIIIAIIALTYIVDVMVEYQFSAMAQKNFDGDNLTAFLGSFYGIWLNLVTFVLQFFLTAFVVTRFGVAGALQIMPVSISIASIATFFLPGVASTGAARLTEAATRYSFNRTGMELLYLPLPLELRNRTKAFTDIFVDRLARGTGGMLLVLLTSVLHLQVRDLALVVLGISIAWMLLSVKAKNEYVTTVRKRLSSRRLDFESLRINVREAGTIRILEETVQTGTPRQAAYALSLLSEAHGYDLTPRLSDLIDNKSPEVRQKVYELARSQNARQFQSQALAEIRSAQPGTSHAALAPAVAYAIASSDNRGELAGRLLTHANTTVSQSALSAVLEYSEIASAIITPEWVAEHVESPSADKRALAATALQIVPEAEDTSLQKLLRDKDPRVVTAAGKTAAAMKSRASLDSLLRLLANSRLRSVAIEGLASYGERIVGTLGDVLLDTTMPMPVRKQIPRILRRIPHQRSVDVLLQSLVEKDLALRAATLKNLNVLREENPKLNYGKDSLQQLILEEIRYYYEMSAALSPLREQGDGTAIRILVTSLEARLRATLERLFRLLGLRYPPKEIYAAYLAMNRRKSDEYTAAIEFLDNVLDRELKRLILPLLDEESGVAQRGRELFGLAEKQVPSALRQLINSGDSWLVACAIATAAELKIAELRPDIVSLSESAGTEVGAVAKAAALALAT